MLMIVFRTCLILLFLNKHVSSLEYGTCDDPFIIFKHTVATSDSQRDCTNAYAIFPEIHDEGATKFQNGLCAYQCKLELPYTCFKIHAPQTQFDEGLLYIDTFESKMNQKWQHAITNNVYDAFFDYNMAFWVKSLDQYISHWESNKEIQLEYIGIEWNVDDIHIDDTNFKNNKFYSILVHSPSSAINFEFVSYTKPSSYNDIKWITESVPRCTFKLMNNPFPWDRDDAATIVPIRISHATTDIDKVYDFYTNILEANLVYYSESMDGETKSIVMQLINTHIELQFVQRSSAYIYDDFTVETYENLLMETHESILTSPYCGQNRWMDNHYAFETYVIPGLMNRIYFNLNRNNIKYTVHKNTYEHVSEYIKHQLDLVYGYEQYTGQYTFGLWVIEPTGQSIKIGGIISDPAVAYFANTNDPQWCPMKCNWGLSAGNVDPSHVYIDETDHNVVVEFNADIEYETQKQHMVYGVIGVLGIVFVLLCFVYWRCKKQESCNNDYVFV